jgi:predicted transcriptional regulator
LKDNGELVSRLLSTETKGYLLALFRKNPGLIDTLEGVARRIGMNAESVRQDVNDLIEIGILNRRKIGNNEVISLNREKDKEIQKKVRKYIMGLGKSG